MISKVLIVEDEKEMRFLLKQFFKKKNLEVLEAGTLEMANHLMEQVDEDTLITLDIDLPDGNGFTFLKRLRQIGKKCKVIICTAYAERSNQALELGADNFIVKPQIMSKLEAILA